MTGPVTTIGGSPSPNLRRRWTALDPAPHGALAPSLRVAGSGSRLASSRSSPCSASPAARRRRLVGGADDHDLAAARTWTCRWATCRPTSAGPPVTVTPEQSQAVLDVVGTYVKDATVQPLRSAKPATADLAGVFDATTLTPATTTDRGVVFDEGLPKVTGDLDVVSQPIAIVGLGDQGGNLVAGDAARARRREGPDRHQERPAPHRAPSRPRARPRRAAAPGRSPPTAWS